MLWMNNRASKHRTARCIICLSAVIAGTMSLPGLVLANAQGGSVSAVNQALEAATQEFTSTAWVAESLAVARKDLADLRLAHKQLDPSAQYAPANNQRDVLGQKIVQTLNRVAQSKLSTPAQKSEAIAMWFALYEESRDWKPHFSASRPLVNVDGLVNGLRNAALELALAARGETGRAQARQALEWLIPLSVFGSGSEKWGQEEAKKALEMPGIVPEARAWALAVVVSRDTGFEEGSVARRLAYFQELVAMAHLSPPERETHYAQFISFLQSPVVPKSEAQKQLALIARNQRLSLAERERAFLNLFTASPVNEQVKIADEMLRLATQPGKVRESWLNYRAGALRDNKQTTEAIAAFDAIAGSSVTPVLSRAFARYEAAKLRYSTNPETGRAAMEAIIDDVQQDVGTRLEVAHMLTQKDYAAKEYALATKVLERALKISELTPDQRYSLNFNLANVLTSNKNYTGAALQIDQIPVQAVMPPFERQLLEAAFSFARRDKDQAGARAILALMEKRGGWNATHIKLQTARLKEDTGDRAGALALYREILPNYTAETDRKYIQETITRLEQPASPQ